MEGLKQEMSILLIIFSIFCITGSGKQVAMKVVEEPSSYGMNFGGGYQQQQQEDSNKLTMRVPPSNFSGPPHLQRLVGKCFTRVQDSYKYELCPFSNISQHEQSLRWNPYSGILGVWQEWEIENNTFVAMLMREGDSCGSVQRSTRVLFECANKTEIGAVSEPHTCQYELHFHTPLVCHRHSMLVYPTLTPDQRHQWDLLETRLLNEEITKKGYKKLLGRIFEQAGYQMEPSKREALIKQAQEKEKEKEKITNGEFETLSQCSDEYKKLKAEVDRLKGLLENNNIEHNEQEKGKNDDFYNEFEHKDHMGEDYDYRHMMDSMGD